MIYGSGLDRGPSMLLYHFQHNSLDGGSWVEKKLCCFANKEMYKG